MRRLVLLATLVIVALATAALAERVAYELLCEAGAPWGCYGVRVPHSYG